MAVASEVCTSLGLGGKDLTGKVVHVAEEHGSESSFVLGSMMWKAVCGGASLCVLALHNPRSHHQHVAKRLGVDLQHATVLEPFAVSPTGLAGLDMGREDNLKRLFLDVKQSLDRLAGRKCLVVDDLSDLLCLGASVAQVLTFLQYCNTLVELDSSLTLVVGTHFSQEDEDSVLVCNATAHLADCRLTVASLRTGFSLDVTGSVRVQAGVGEGRLFHYRLTDRQVKVFAPGAAGLHR